MAVLNSVPIPLNDPIATPRREGQKESLEGLLTKVWQLWFDQLGLTIESAPARIKTVPLSAQNASIAATDLTGGTISAGLYEVKVNARITQAATVSSSLTVSLDWAVGGVTQSYSWPAMTGNLVTTILVEPPLFIRVDSLSPIRYSAAYASVGATPMLYSLDVVLSEIAA